jgi:putative ABC transport system permease protein
MELRDTFKMAVTALSARKVRSSLTILGIVIGITAITIVTSLGDSAQGFILGELESFGSNSAFIIPGKEGDFSEASILTDSLGDKDVVALRNKGNVPDAELVVPFVFGPAVVIYESEKQFTSLLGASPGNQQIDSLELAEGEFINDEDVEQKAAVIILGSNIKEELFGSSDAVGERVKIEDKTYRVIGVLEPKGQSLFVDYDEVAIVPYTTAQQYILGYDYIQRIVVRGTDAEKLAGMVKDIEITLRDSHNIENPEDDDFFVQTSEDAAATFGTITDVLTILLASIAGISLVVGGVGIMNIMLVSVTERTREIGLRKALGAKNSDILLQFLIEAVILTGIGGVIGIIAGSLISYLATIIIYEFAGINFPFVSPVSGALVGVGFSTAIGFIFGIYPARQASKKSPIEALRYE